MYVNFHTDSSTERSGFRMEVEQLKCEGERIVREEQEPEKEEKENQAQQQQQQRILQEQEQEKEVVQEKKDNGKLKKKNSISKILNFCIF